ncbi:MAG TPA: allophanate hydrolase [Bauldia sp.]|nr:allophanate hydrolase [Bauldia sp.]
MADLDFDIARLHAAYAAGADPAAAVDAAYRRLKTADDPGIFISLVDEAEAKAAARRLPKFDPATMPLWGVPFAAKDNIDVAGIPTTAGCREFAYVPAVSAPVVERLIAAGAILIGKTNLDQFAAGLVGVRTPYPVPRNAIDPTVVPGGSSSGSAVAVARGIVSFALGTDTAGSGRIPAALNNVVGLKPSRGALSARGVVPACRTLDCVSIFAATVDDAWRIAKIAAAYDAEDAYSRRISLGAATRPPVLRIGVPDAASLIFDSDIARAAFDAALAAFPDFGAKFRQVDLGPFYAAAQRLYEGAWVAERYAAIRDFIETRPEALYPATRAIIEGSRRLSAADAFADQYRLAELARSTSTVWDTIDVLVVPSMPDVCTLEQIAADPLVPNRRLGTYTNFVNLLDLCAIAVPGPFRTDGRAAGVTLIAPAGRDGLLAAMAAEIHAKAGVKIGATGRELPPSSLPKPTPDGAIPIAVVGAHLSGMGLNHELTARGATFIKATATEASYKLYALNGGPPSRPGLVRTTSGGASIATEVWALPPAAFGEFVATIPSPLGIGTLKLADGSSVKGFLCEAAAVDGAKDITSFGGWRAYVASLG